MILAVDIGNSNIVVGVYEQKQLIRHWRLATRTGSTADEYGILLTTLFEQSQLDVTQIEGAVMASVVPPLIVAWMQVIREKFAVEPLLVEPANTSVMPNLYEHPAEVGADRIVNALAGVKKYGAPLIVVDFGTATTFDVINQAGAYLGGAIAPGIGISTDALFAHAAKLPRIELVRPQQVIGRNSVASMQAGIVYGFAGQVDAIVQRIWKELETKTEVVATGGLAAMIAQETATIQHVDPLLTLEGLRIIYEINLKESG